MSLEIEYPKASSKDFNDIRNYTSFTGIYDGQYGLYHKHFSQLIRVMEDCIKMVTNDTRQMGSVMILNFCEMELSTTATAKKKGRGRGRGRGRPRKQL